jgi:uncharacterized membrane protein
MENTRLRKRCAMTIGPLQLLVIGLEQPALDGRILDSLLDVRDEGMIRIVDMLGVYKDEEGNIIAAQVSDLSLDEAVTYGAWVGALIGLGAGGEAGMEAGAVMGALVSEMEYEYGLDEEALDTIADDIPPGGAAILAVIEHRWAIPFRDAVRSQGGLLIAQDFLNPESLIELGALGAL